MFYLILLKDKLSWQKDISEIHTFNNSNDVNQYLLKKFKLDYYNQDYNGRMYLYSNEFAIVVNDDYPQTINNFENNPQYQFEQAINNYIIDIRDEKINKIIE